MKLLGGAIAALTAVALTVLVFFTLIIPNSASAFSASGDCTGGGSSTSTAPVAGAGALLAARAAQVAGLPATQLVTATAVAGAESGWDPTQTYHNTNGTTDHGLWQINDVNTAALALGDWKDPVTNARMMVMLWKQSGWHPWTTFNDGKYVKFLPEATAAVAKLSGTAAVPASLSTVVSTDCAPGGGGAGTAASGKGPARPFPGGSGTTSDPTSGGFLTKPTAWMLSEIWRNWGHWPAACWDQHAWNPRSDHPKGKACDFTVGTIGKFPQGAVKAHGWDLFRWLQANASPLHINYLIYQGQIWEPSRGMRPYSGGGVYNPSDVTGGHFDHIHVSVN